MSLRNRLALLFALSTLAVLAGCGSGSSNPVAPPTGGFSNTNFNGTYTFSVLGADAGNGTGSAFAMAGSFTACGCTAGTISGGTVDLVDNTGPAPASTVGSNSTYSITKDGRGFAKLMITTTANTSFEVDVDFVLISSSHGLITRFDGSGTGSGTIDLQSSVSQATLANLPFAFSLSGADLAGDPLSIMGAFTLDSSGNISTTGANAGVADATIYNFSTFSASPFANAALSGSVQVGSGTTPGPATLSIATFGTLAFDVYPIDGSHLKLIETDGFEILVGDVFTQPSASIPAGNWVFSMLGPDPGGNPFAAAGIMTTTSSNQITTGAEDLNDNGVVDFGNVPVTPQPFSGAFTATGGGRFQITLSTFAGGTTFAAYPSSGGLLMQEIDSGVGSGVTSGAALQQTSGASIAASQGYGLNLTGVDLINLVEADEIAEYTTTSSTLTGLVDINDGGSLSTQSLSGNYTTGSGGLGSASLSAGFGSMFFYPADNTNVLLLSTDPTVVGLGSFQSQVTPAQSSMEQPRTLSALHYMPHPRSAAAKGKAAKNTRFVRR